MFNYDELQKLEAEQAEARGAKTEKKSFTNEPVEAGVYELEIKSAPVVKISKKGNTYLSLFLTHTETKGAAAVNHIISKTEVGGIQLSQLLLNLGYSEAELRSTGFDFEAEDLAELENTGITGAVIRVGGSDFSAEDLVGQKVKAYLTKKEETYVNRDGEEVTSIKNKVSRFNA